MTLIAGAGLAGLEAALALAEAGRRVVVLESGPAAGGRCRSYYDRELDVRLDNGNHLLLSGNDAAFRYLRRLGTQDTLTGPGAPVFPFMDMATGERWVLRPGRGRWPGWIFSSGRRVPGTRARDYLGLLRWAGRLPAGATVARVAPPGALYRRLIEPLAIAALNTMPEEGDAALMAAVVRQTLLRGGSACVPAFPREGLSESFVFPAVARLRSLGADIRFGCRVTALQTAGGRVIAMDTTDGPIEVPGEAILAVPAPIAAGLLPDLTVPDAHESILNLHYRIDADTGPAGFTGVVGGFAEWIFVKHGVVSVTVSAANRFADLSPEEAAARGWAEVRRVLDLPEPMPAWRVVREKRATFAATPAQCARRPAPEAADLANLTLAGDWTETGLPATIEGAIRSGARAAKIVLSRGAG